MKKYLILSFLFLLAITPVLAKSTTGAQQGQQANTTSGGQKHSDYIFYRQSG